MVKKTSNQLVISPERCYYLDTMGGLLIIRVVLWHCFQWAGLADNIKSLMEVLGFVMLWYFYKGGMFYKPRSFKYLWDKACRRLLLPFIVFSIIGTIFLGIDWYVHEVFSWRYLIKTFIGGLVKNGAVPGNQALWFLIALMFSRLLFNYLYFHKYKLLWLLIMGVWPIIAYYFVQPYFFIPLYLTYIPIGVTFFALGHYFRDYNPSISIILICIIFYSCGISLYPTYVDMRENTLIYGKLYLLWYPMSLIAIVGINGIARKLLNFSSWLSKLGQNTMSCFCLHWIILIIVDIFYPSYLKDSRWLLLSCFIVANLIFIPVFTFLIKKTRFKYLI